ncbi:Germin-like protein 9-3 [Linum grandiflorum]
MATKTLKSILTLLLLISSLTTFLQPTMAADPDILTDFILPQNSTTNITSQFFTFSGMRPIFHQRPQDFTIAKASLAQFPALEGQSVSYAVLQFPAGTTNPPHIHPRASELLYLARGSLQVGFVDTANKLYTQTLQLGDMFVFPKGLVHFQYNVGKVTAVAFSAFGSANAGTVSLPPTLFTSGIDDDVLVKGFKSDVTTIQSLKAGLSAKK